MRNHGLEKLAKSETSLNGSSSNGTCSCATDR